MPRPGQTRLFCGFGGSLLKEDTDGKAGLSDPRSHGTQGGPRGVLNGVLIGFFDVRGFIVVAECRAASLGCASSMVSDSNSSGTATGRR